MAEGLMAVEAFDREKHPDPQTSNKVAGQMGPYIRHAPAIVPRIDISDLRAEAHHLHSLLHHMKNVESPQLVESLLCLTASQRADVVEMYEELFEKGLAADLQEHDLLDDHPVIAALVLPHVLYIAEELHRNIQDDLVILEILYTMYDPERKLVNEAYEKIFMLKFSNDLSHHYEGEVLRMLVSFAEGTHSDSYVVEKDQIESDAKALYEAGQNEDIGIFADIFATRSHAQLFDTIMLMPSIANTEIEDIVHFRLQGPLVPILLAIISLVRCKELFFAKQINKVMESEANEQTKIKDLLRIFLLRAEKDLVNVEKEYERLYGMNIVKVIQESKDFSSTAKHNLCLLVQGTPEKFRWEARLDHTGQLGIVAGGLIRPT
ncbi:annexin A5-like [Paramacrobiotus metropolitanus]|uniref:annexin A5-like n=1 Tax=Paramacrobiotus metropolitanus TaxID=2943436 RepID=UPI002445EA91|nr:annexin A5-like [Paramacrobiotus metropolitanus]